MSGWKFWNRGLRDITDELRTVLMNEFSVDSQEADKMRFVQRRGKYGGRSVRYVQLFQPRKGVQFAGRIERGGYVRLVDRRNMSAA